MDRFWTWLMQANSRGVFAVALIPLVLVSGWWVRNELRPTESVFTSDSTGQYTPKATTHLGVLDVVEAQLAVDPQQVPETPFRPALGSRRRRSYESRRNWRSARTNVTFTAIDPFFPDGVRSSPNFGTGTGDATLNIATLIYRGIFKRSDGTELILIEDTREGRSSFLAAGSELHDITLDSASSTQLSVIGADGNVYTLPEGQPVNFSNGVPLHE